VKKKKKNLRKEGRKFVTSAVGGRGTARREPRRAALSCAEGVASAAGDRPLKRISR